MTNSKKKILIFSLAYHPFVGGAEVAIKEITDRLGVSAQGGPASGWDFDMVTVNLDGKQKLEERLGQVNVHRVGSRKLDKYRFPWLASKKAQELHKKNNYDAVWGMMANQAGWAAMKFKKKNPDTKFLLTLQMGDSDFDIWLRTFFIRPIYKSIYRSADYIQAISNFLAQRAKKLGAKCPVEVVPNGIKLVDQQPVTSNQKIIFTASRLVKKNAVEDVIRAMVRVDAKFIIAGEGNLRGKLEALTKKLDLSDKVKFLGQVSYDEVYKNLSQADVFVRPSLSEGLGNSFLEAMSVGVPVVATPVGGIPDFLHNGETGWFCEVKNPKSIAQKINYILDPQNKEKVFQVIVNAKQMVEEKYTWESVTSKMRNIFNQLCQ